MLDILEILIDEMSLIKSLMNDFSFSLPLGIDYIQLSIYWYSIGMVIVREAWSNNNLHSR